MALNSAGSAAQENAKYLESLEAREQSLKAEFEDFANRVLSKDVVAGFYNAAEAALKFVNTDFGAATTRITGTAAAITSLVGILGTMGAKLTLVGKQLQSFGAADGLLGLLTTPKTLLIVAGVVTAIAGLVEIVKAANDTIEKNKWENLVSTMNESNQELEETKQGYEDVKKKLDELNNTPYDGKQSELEAEREQLLKQIDAYEKLIKLRQEETVEAAREVLSKGKQTTGAQVSGLLQDEFGSTVLQTWNGQIALTQEQLHTVSKSYESVEDATNAAFEALHEYVDATSYEAYLEATSLGNWSEAAEIAEAGLVSLGVTITETKQKTVDWAQAQGTALSNWATYSQRIGSFNTESRESVDGLVTSTKDYYDALKILSDNGENLDQWQVDFITNWETLIGIVQNTDLSGAANDVQEVGDAAEDSASKLDTYIAALDEYRGANEDAASSSEILVNSLFDANGQLTEAAQQALTTDGAMASMAQSFIKAQQAQAQADFSVLILAIQQVGSAATITSSQLSNMMALAGTPISGVDTEEGMARFKGYVKAQGYSDVQSYIKTVGLKNYQKKMDEYKKQLEAIKPFVPSSGGGGGSSAKKEIDETADYAKEKAKEAAEKAAQEAEQAAKEAAEKVKEQINEAFDALKEAEEAYWDDKIDALETQNKLLDRQTQLEEKLKALQEAKQKRILLYKDGRFQYSEDVDKISSAQYEYDETYRNIYVEEQKEILNDLKDKALSLIEEYRDAALENGELNKENISALLDDYRALGDTTYQTIAYGVDNITNLIASGMSAISGASTNIGTSVTSTMNTIGSAMTKMTGSVSSAAGLLNKQFGDKLSAIQGVVSGTGVGSIGGSQSLSAFRDKHWGETTGKFNKLSLLYGGGQAWWMGMMSKYLEDPEKNANLQIGTKDDGSPLTLKELYETDWAKEASKMDSVGGIEDYIQRAQAKSILSGGTKADYDALNKIAQDAYREAYFRNPRTIAPSAKWYGGYDPKFSAAQYAVDAALRYSGSTHDVFDVEGAHTSGMSAGRVSDLKFLEELVEQGKKSGASGTSQTQAVWAKSELEKRYQESYKSTVDAIDKQIAENSQKWYTASDEEKDRLHLLNEELRKNRSEYANKINKNASGTTSSRGGLSLVGEEGPELRVLNRGDGVLPTDVTNNLWRWGSMTPSDMLSSLAQKAQSLAQTLNINNVTLPNVRDAQSFINGLRELAQQYVTRRS